MGDVIKYKFLVDKNGSVYGILSTEEFAKYDIGELVIEDGKGYVVHGEGYKNVSAIKTKLKTDGTVSSYIQAQTEVPMIFYCPQKKSVFNWIRFLNKDNKIAVHCKTKEEAEDFCEKMDALGLMWSNGTSYKENSRWEDFRREIYYGNTGGHTFSDFYKKEGYEIFEWGDYMERDLRDLLKNGTVVELREGSRCIVVNDRLMGIGDPDFSEKILKYSNGLQFNGENRGMDIMKVYGHGYTISQCMGDMLPVVWERKKRKITMEDIKKQFGEDIEVVI